MEMLAIGLGILNLAGGLFGSSGQKQTDKARTQLIYDSNLEEIRRREFEQDQIKGATVAMSETGGVLHSQGSSAQTYIDLMSSEFGKELKFMREYAERARQLGLQQAQLNFQTGLFNSLSGGLQTYGIFKS